MLHAVTAARTTTAHTWLSVPDAFQQNASRHPDALAVEAQGERRSYGDMARRVDTLAARLAAMLVDDDRLVGVCLARDVDLPAWLLAILKVGAAYLPIDPTTPPARLAQVVADARPTLIVANRRYESVVGPLGIPTIIAEDDPGATVDVSVTPITPVTANTLAYVIFTSGSTGRPKGVEIEHGSLVALLATMATCPGFHSGARMLGVTRLGFDMSVPDMFLPFYTGGSLALVDGDDANDPARLAAAIQAYRPDLMQATPSTWRALTEHGWEGAETLHIVVGGEALTRTLADRLLRCCGALWNMYGPTETTVWSTICRILPDGGAVAIGRPLPGTSVRVTDAALSPVPAGVVGEIVIGGIGVARGYRHRPELTAERFVRLADGTRAYRTGDLGRIDGEGTLFCLGRLDDQVKVRGFRIELGDVEAALALHPGVAWSAALLWTDPSDHAVLVGYVVPRGAAIGAGEIKAFLATRIAPYMIPDRIVTLTVMPLNPNGKVDRPALPTPFVAGTPPCDAADDASIDRRLAAIWCDLLHITSIAPEDDFFDLGGYSLMTVRLALRIEAAFGVRLALIELMRHSTLAAMAARIATGERSAAPAVMLLNAGGTRPPLFWLDAGPLMRTMLRGLSADQPAFALNADVADDTALGDGPVSIPALAGRLKRHLLAERPAGPYYLGGWCRWGIVAFELAQQLVAEGHDVGLLALLDTDRPGMTTAQGLRGRMASLLRPRAPGSDEPASLSQRVERATRSYVADRYRGDVLLLRPATGGGQAGWDGVVDGTLTIARTPGDHITMVRGAPAAALATALDRALATAQRHRRISEGLAVTMERAHP